jgi:hypothetical protein
MTDAQCLLKTCWLLPRMAERYLLPGLLSKRGGSSLIRLIHFESGREIRRWEYEGGQILAFAVSLDRPRPGECRQR